VLCATGAIAGALCTDCAVERARCDVVVTDDEIVDVAALAVGSSLVLMKRDPPSTATPTVANARKGILLIPLRDRAICVSLSASVNQYGLSELPLTLSVGILTLSFIQRVKSET